MNPTLNGMDRIIGYFAPTFMVKRAQARHAAFVYQQYASRKYEAASKSKRTKGWLTQPTSANTETWGTLGTLRDRSRDLRRNNPHAKRAIDIISSNTVGTGIQASFKVRGEKPKPAQQKALEAYRELWEDWAESSACDADGNFDIYGIQNLIMQTVPEAGEILIRRRRRRAEDGLPVPLQIQVLEPDFIDSFRNETLSNGGKIVQGVEYDAIGKKVAYWLFPEHPGDLQNHAAKLSTRYPAEDIIHVKRVERAGQVRGVPWLAPAILRLRDFDDYEDATLLRQKISACYTVFISDTELPLDGSNGSSSVPEKVGPGMIEQIGPGKKVDFASPPQVQDTDFTKRSLRGIAMGTGCTYEQLTGDLSNVNFSSARLGLLDFNRQVDQWRWFMLIPAMRTIMGWFTEAAMLVNVKPQNVRTGWTPPKREMIDPVSETNAALTQIRGGMKTLYEDIRERGGEPEHHLKEIAEANALIDELNLTLDTDPRRMSKIGFAQAGESLEMLAGLEPPKPAAAAAAE